MADRNATFEVVYNGDGRVDSQVVIDGYEFDVSAIGRNMTAVGPTDLYKEWRVTVSDYAPNGLTPEHAAIKVAKMALDEFLRSNE